MTKAELNKRIEQLCEAKGIAFQPWEFPRPWEVGDNDPDPGPPGGLVSIWWPKLLALRAALKAEVLAEAKRSLSIRAQPRLSGVESDVKSSYS